MIAHAENGAAFVRDIQDEGRKRLSHPIRHVSSEEIGKGCVDWYEFVPKEKPE